MVGTTRARVNDFMLTFKKPGFAHAGEVSRDLTIHHSLLSVVQHDYPDQ
jgi:hypothetical protein